IAATIRETSPRPRSEPIQYAYADQVRFADFIGEGSGAAPGSASQCSSVEQIEGLAGQIRTRLASEPRSFAELAEEFAKDGLPAVHRALGELHQAGELWQDPSGRYCLVGSPYSAVQPTARPSQLV